MNIVKVLMDLIENREYVKNTLSVLKSCIYNHYMSNVISDSYREQLNTYMNQSDICLQLNTCKNQSDICQLIRDLITNALNLNLVEYSHKTLESEIRKLEKSALGGSYTNPVDNYNSNEVRSQESPTRQFNSNEVGSLKLLTRQFNSDEVRSLKLLTRQFIKQYVTNLLLPGLKFCSYQSKDLNFQIIEIETELLGLLTNNMLIQIIQDQCDAIHKNNIIIIIENSFQFCVNLIKNKFDANNLIYMCNHDIDNYYNRFKNSKYRLEFVPNTYHLSYVVTGLTKLEVNISDINVEDIFVVYSKSGGVIVLITDQHKMTLNEELTPIIIGDKNTWGGTRLDYFDNDSYMHCDYYYDQSSSTIVAGEDWFDNSQELYRIKISKPTGLDDFEEIHLFTINEVMYITDSDYSSDYLTIFRLDTH